MLHPAGDRAAPTLIARHVRVGGAGLQCRPPRTSPSPPHFTALHRRPAGRPRLSTAPSWPRPALPPREDTLVTQATQAAWGGTRMGPRERALPRALPPASQDALRAGPHIHPFLPSFLPSSTPACLPPSPISGAAANLHRTAPPACPSLHALWGRGDRQQ